MTMERRWNYAGIDEIHQNLKDIALAGIKRIVWECDSLDDEVKIAEIDGILTFLDDVEEDMEGKDDD